MSPDQSATNPENEMAESRAMQKLLELLEDEVKQAEPEKDDDALYYTELQARRGARTSELPSVLPRIARTRPRSNVAAASTVADGGGSADALVVASKHVRVLARAALARRHAVDAVSARDITLLAELLVRYASTPGNPPDMRINYDAFCSVRDGCPPRLAGMLDASMFLKLPRDDSDRVGIAGVCRFVAYKAQLHAMWRRLSSYDSEGDGCLREHDLENHVFEAIPELPDLASLQENFHPFYVFTAVRKFFFLLDPSHLGRIRIADLVGSRVYHEWLQLWHRWPAELSEAAGAALPHDTSASADSLSTQRSTASSPAAAALIASIVPAHPGEVPPSNWFSAANAVRVYSQYLNLDADQNGLLSQAELARINNGSYTDLFITRLFQEVHTYSGEMDYKAYLDFVLATEYRTAPQSIKYLFRVLDARKTGALTLFDLRTYFREVASRLSASGHDPIDVANVCDEIFDMVHPVDSVGVTLADLRRCKLGGTVLQILTDAAGFWQYDNREMLLQQQMQSADSEPARDAHAGLDHEFA